MRIWQKLFRAGATTEPRQVPAERETSRPAPESPSIHELVEKGDLEGVRALLDARPGVIDSTDSIWSTPLILAAERGDKAMAELLLARGSDREKARMDGYTALQFAAWEGNTEFVELLLANGARVNKLTYQTALHVAARSNRKEVVDLLLAHGADAWARDPNGKTPADWAAEAGHNELADLLRDRQVAAAVLDSDDAAPLPDGWDDGCDEVFLLMATAWDGKYYWSSDFMTMEVMGKLGPRLGSPAERVRKSELARRQLDRLLEGPIDRIEQNLRAFAWAAAMRILRTRNASLCMALLSDMEDIGRNNRASLCINVLAYVRTGTGSLNVASR